MKQDLYSHFEHLLSVPDKPLVLTDANFATKVNPRRAYPVCTVNTGSLFDEDGDPIFHIQVTSTPAPPIPGTIGKAKKGAKKTGSSLKRTLGTASSRRKKSAKTALVQPLNEQIQPEAPVDAQVLAPPPPPLPVEAVPTLPPTPAPATTPARKQKPFRYPSLLTLPSKVAYPRNQSDNQFLENSFLPTSSLKRNALFNAFITFASASENNCVLVSRAFASSTITLHDSHLAIRQVLLIIPPPPSTFTQ